MNSRWFRSCLFGVCILVSACAGAPRTITDGSTERRTTAEQDQRTADTFRTAGAGQAARQAQERADRSRAAADTKPSSFLDWVADVLFYSWLNSASEPARR